MAEFIPTSYRLRMVRRQLLASWGSGLAFAVAVAACALGAASLWEHRCAAENAALRAEFKTKSVLIQRSEDLRSRRQDLANRMQKIQKLMDDKTLLSLLHNISEGFSRKDCLQYINIDARADDRGNHNKAEPADGHYVVHITGITESSTTLAELMTRLGKRTDPAVNVVLQSSKREPLLDGQVVRFEILCEQPKGS